MKETPKNPKFDSSQKKSGFNKYNYYQFGYLTCQFCKNDDTTTNIEYHNGKKYVFVNCSCGGRGIPKQLN